ncbi:MAG: SPASM domain-containing protein [Firmicutes bacterium]|nr:SPASM domain-containing protein [Bacillota bacterium]
MKVLRKKSKEFSKLDNGQIDKILKYIRYDIAKRNTCEENFIAFFGGEPSLVPEVVSQIIEKTRGLDFKYIFCTNGLALDKFPRELLKFMSAILVSVDGEKENQEKYRGKGSYDRIIKNVKMLKADFNKPVIGRMTLEEDINVYRSVIDMLDTFDLVHWQIVGKPKFNFPEKFIANYKAEIAELFKYWYSNFEAGKIVGIIPFQAVTWAMLFPEEEAGRPSFRCGNGHDIQIIDMAGNMYECDELLGEHEWIVGNINNGKYPHITYEAHTDIFEDCRVCEISRICLGRCRRTLKIYEKEQIRNYCQLTKALVGLVLKHKKELAEIARARKYTPHQVYPGPCHTEEIP